MRTPLTLALILAVIILPTTLHTIHASTLPPIGKLDYSTAGPVGTIPKTPGPCKKCRDFAVNVSIIDAYKWAHNKVTDEYVPAGLYTPEIVLTVSKQSLTLSDKNCSIASTTGWPFCNSTISTTYVFRNVAGSSVYVWFDVFVWAFEEHHVYTSTSMGRYRLYVSILNLENIIGTAIAGNHVLRVEGHNRPGTITKTRRGVGFRPLVTRASWIDIYRFNGPAWSSANTSIHYFYTLVLGVSARAYWLNGSPVNLPGVGIVDGWVPTSYWSLTVLGPSSAFTRWPVPTYGTGYSYYVYYAIPDRVFKINVTRSFIVPLGTSRCLNDTWCPVESKRCGSLVLFCRAAQDMFRIALPSDWNMTIRYICTLNSSRSLVMLYLRSIGIVYLNHTAVLTLNNIGNWSLTHLATGITYRGKFPAENWVCVNDTYNIAVVRRVVVNLNGTLYAECRLAKLTLWKCRDDSSTCISNDWLLAKETTHSSITWNTDTHAWSVFAIYNCTLMTRLCFVKVYARDVRGNELHVAISYVDRFNNTTYSAGIGKTPFTVAVPCNSLLTLTAPDSWRGYVFVNWTGTYVNSTFTVIVFNVSRSVARQVAYYGNGTVGNVSGVCPIVLSGWLGNVLSVSYSESRTVSVSVSASAYRTCRCDCSWVYVCDRYNETTGECVEGHWECTGSSISCSGRSSDSDFDSGSGSLRGSSKTWRRVLLFGTLRIPALEGSGWSICAGLWLQETSIRVSASALVKASAGGEVSRSESCGCETSDSRDAYAMSRVSSLHVDYHIYGSGNVPIISKLNREVKHRFYINKRVTANLERTSSSDSWSGSWSTTVPEYGGEDRYVTYTIAGGDYRWAIITSVSEYKPDSYLYARASAYASIVSDPRCFTCDCNHCGASCTCTVSISASSTAIAGMSANTNIKGGHIQLRAGIADDGTWIVPWYNRLRCNDYACEWYGNHDPFSHSGTLSISWTPIHPLPGQVTTITVKYRVSDNKQPVRLWVYKVVEHVWDPDRHAWVTKTYDLRLATPWEISKAPRGKAEITFRWRFPNGYITICARGWGVFTTITDRCWNIYPAVIVLDVKPIYTYYRLDRDKAYAVVSKYLMEQRDSVHAPDLYLQYGIVLKAYVHACPTVRVRISDVDPADVYYVNIRHGRMYYRHGSPVLFNGEVCLSEGTWLLLVPAGRLYRLELPEDKAIRLDLGNATSILISKSALLDRTWITYSIEVTLGKYYRFRRTIVLSLIKHVPVMVWSTDMPKVWIIPRYVYDNQIVIGTWFSYILRCGNYTISIVYNNYTLTSIKIPVLGIVLPPGVANNGSRTLQIDQRLFTGRCMLYVTDLPTTSIVTTWTVNSNYLKIEPSETTVKIGSSLPIHHWTISVITDGALKNVTIVKDRKSIVLKVRDYARLPGHNIDVMVKTYSTCVGLCRPEKKTVITVRK